MTEPNYSTDPDLDSALGKLTRYGRARDRQVDREPREVVLTDDEALAVVVGIDVLVSRLAQAQRDLASTALKASRR